MGRILITGGAGFIGSNIIRRLNLMGFKDIIVVDSFTNPSKHLNLNNRSFYDIINKDHFFSELPKLGPIDYIFHEGACSDTTNMNGDYMIENNYTFTKKLVDFAMANNIDISYASSAAVYGNGSNGFNDSHNDYFPLNIYAYSKLLVDRYVSDNYLKNVEFKNQIVGFRYFNVFGYNEMHKGNMKSVIAKFYNDLNAGKSSVLFEDSNHIKRDFIFIEDLLDIVFYFFENRNLNGIYNCGTGKTTSFLDLAHFFGDNFPDFKFEYIPFPAELVGKYQNFTMANTKKITRVGFDLSKFSITKGVNNYCENLKSLNGII